MSSHVFSDLPLFLAMYCLVTINGRNSLVLPQAPHIAGPCSLGRAFLTGAVGALLRVVMVYFDRLH